MGVKFNAEDIYGKQIQVVTRTTDMLVEILKDESAAPEKKALTAQILDYISKQAKEHAHLPPLDQAAYRMLSEFQADRLWTRVARLETKAVNGVDQQTYHLA
jgi:hypothetical protein